MSKKKQARCNRSPNNAQKKKQKSIDDKTLGLENKNKSKKCKVKSKRLLQVCCTQATPKFERRKKKWPKQRVDRKLRVKAAKDEQYALVGAALLDVQNKGSTSKKEGKVEAQGRDRADENTKKSTSGAMKMMFKWMLKK
jgi:hypothetical protein